MKEILLSLKQICKKRKKGNLTWGDVAARYSCAALQVVISATLLQRGACILCVCNYYPAAWQLFQNASALLNFAFQEKVSFTLKVQ